MQISVLLSFNFLGLCGRVAGKAKMVEICEAPFVWPFVWTASQCRHSLIQTVLTDKDFWPETLGKFGMLDC